jgi:hypothetical protein
MEKSPPTSPLSQKWKILLLLLVLPLPLALLGFSGLAAAGPMLADFTPTVIIYLPVIVKVPTPTFTPTPPATSTPAASATPTQPAYPGGSTSVSGSLTLDSNKPTYADRCENVWFHQVIHNDDGGKTLNWGILGESVVGPGMNVFHTSWSAPNASGQVFPLYPNCFGPNGMPCASNSGGGAAQDAIGGYRPDSQLINPGTYSITEAICLSSYTACTHNAGTWRTLSSVSIVAVDWYDPTCNRTIIRTTVQSTDPLAGCHLDTSDPQNIKMVCPSK